MSFYINLKSNPLALSKTILSILSPFTPIQPWFYHLTIIILLEFNLRMYFTILNVSNLFYRYVIFK